MCITNDGEIAEKMRMLRDHGIHPERTGKSWALVEAAVGVGSVAKKRFIEKKRRVAKIYAEELAIDGIELHPEMPWAKCVLAILQDENKLGVSRDVVVNFELWHRR